MKIGREIAISGKKVNRLVKKGIVRISQKRPEVLKGGELASLLGKM